MGAKGSYAAVALVLTAIWGTGCATKGYVRAQVQPVNTKVDQVQAQTQKQGAQLDQTAQQVQQNQTEISATKEIATSADSRASQNARQLGELRNVVANLDDYKVANQTVVHFGFNKDALTTDTKQDLDKLVAQLGSAQRYFITVEGFTDQTGPAGYNEELSRRRANHVIEYLVGEKDIPLQRIFIIGLGERKLIDSGRTREARAESRRVELTLYTAPPLSTAASASK